MSDAKLIAAQALSVYGVPDIWDLRAAGVAVDAARPIIEEEIRSSVADALRAMPGAGFSPEGRTSAYPSISRSAAIRLALGEQ